MAILGKKGGKAPPAEKAGGMSFDPPVEASREDSVNAEESIVVPADVESTPVVGQDGADADVDVVPVAAPEAPFEPATSRFGRLGRKKEPGVAVPKAEKPVKVKAVKVAKPKAAKGEDRLVDDYPIPVMMIIEFYEGLKKESVAEQLGRALIEKNFAAPNASYVYTQKWRNGMAVEVQEGGGEAYLPEILAKLDEDPNVTLAVPMSNRIAQVRLDGETGRLEMLLLLNNQEPPEGAFVPLPSKAMKPFDRRGSRLFVSGVAVLASTVVAAVFSVGAFFIDTHSWALPFVQQTDVKILPMAHIQEMKDAKAKGDCLFKAEYVGNSWKMTPGYELGGLCVKDRPNSAQIQASGAVDALPVAGIVPGGTLPPGVGGPATGVPGTVAPTMVPPSGIVPGVGVPGAGSPQGAGMRPGGMPVGPGTAGGTSGGVMRPPMPMPSGSPMAGAPAR